MAGVAGVAYLALLARLAWKTRMGRKTVVDSLHRAVRRGLERGELDAGLGRCEVAVTDEAVVTTTAVMTMRLAWSQCTEAEFAPEAVSIRLFGPGVLDITNE